ncbi:MAG: LuxR C-terminal-related transcriptional regulator [Kribbellaceae bacterium]
MTVPVGEVLAEGRAALRTGDAARARRAFERALADEPSGPAWEGMAGASYLELAFPRAVEEWESAYAAYRAAGDLVGAVRAARTLGYLYGTAIGDGAVSGGWIARAKTMLASTETSNEAGWIALTDGMFTGDRVRREERFRTALKVARRYGDTELELATLAYLGANLVHADRTEEGMVLLDEALAAVAGGEVDDFFVLEEIFCQLFSACERAHDVTRADQWIRIGDALAQRRNLPAVSAYCRTHYGGILTAAGRWPEADAALTEAVRLWGLGRRMLRSGALVRLAELRVRQGRLEEAGQLLAGLHVDADTARPLAALHLANGDTALALDALERALQGIPPGSTAAAPLLALMVDVHLAAGDTAQAETAVEALEACAAGRTDHYLRGVAALARGRLCLASGSGDARGCLHQALDGFARAQLPMEAARSRLELAAALVTERPEVALTEARAALDGFERLQAARHVDAAAALLRSLGVRVSAGPAPGALTKREAEVLDLLGHGLSNPEISERLFISRKTVEHHVGNVLSKLGLRSRAEAAAYAVRSASAGKPATE